MFVRRETGEADGGERPYALPVLKLDEPQPDETSDGGQQRQRRRFVRGLVETALLAILVFLSVRASFQNFRVDGNSMYPTLDDGQFLIVNKLVYSEIDMDKLSKFLPFVDAEENEKRYVFHGPQRGDIVVMRDPRRPDQDLIKRVIGLPGETVEIRNGMVYVNGFLLEEPYIQAAWHDSRPKVTIPEGQYFVMGDNRDNSLDSRSAQVGLISKNLIVGKAALTYWPFDKFGLAPNQFGTSQKPRLTDTPIPPADSLAGVATDESR
jgi:signal peptidase I